MSVTERSADRIDAVLADLRGEYGEFDAGSRTETLPRDSYRATVNRFERGAVGGTSVRVRDGDDRLLLVRRAGEDAWVDPGDRQAPDETLPDCARRATREAAGLDPTVTGVARADRFAYRTPEGWPAVHAVTVVFEGRADGTPVPGDGYDDARFHAGTPDRLAYDDLADAFE